MPHSVIDGILIFVGLIGIFQTALWDLTLCVVRCVKSPSCPNVSASKLRAFVGLQLSGVVLCWILLGSAMANKDAAVLGLCVPIVIALLIPFRSHLMTRWFTPEELAELDPTHTESMTTSPSSEEPVSTEPCKESIGVAKHESSGESNMLQVVTNEVRE